MKPPFNSKSFKHFLIVMALLTALMFSTIAFSAAGLAPGNISHHTIWGLIMFGIISLLIVLPKPKPGTVMRALSKTGKAHIQPIKRQPDFQGAGIYMSMQFLPERLVKGDTCWDADFGYMRWTGKKWVYID